jgi:hypothetical protein
MQHTPTPWIKQETIIEGIHGNIVANFQHGEWEYTNSQENMNRIVACVNACEGMEDPWADILAMSTDLSVGKSIMDEKDKEIQALRDRVKELELIIAETNKQLES